MSDSQSEDKGSSPLGGAISTRPRSLPRGCPVKRILQNASPTDHPISQGSQSLIPKEAKARGPDIIAYEQQLNTKPEWALREGSRHFEEKSDVFAAVHKIAQRLDALNIPYAVVGGMALFRHGLRRFTEDVDILVTKKDLKRIHEELEGAGYLPVHPRSKNLRDTGLRVRIEFLTSGDYPGDGKEKPVAFPDPQTVSEVHEGIRYVSLPKLIEMKLASGMTNASRLKDLADVMELIKRLDLPRDYADKLNPYVREKFYELCKGAGEGRSVRGK